MHAPKCTLWPHVSGCGYVHERRFVSWSCLAVSQQSVMKRKRRHVLNYLPSWQPARQYEVCKTLTGEHTRTQQGTVPITPRQSGTAKQQENNCTRGNKLKSHKDERIIWDTSAWMSSKENKKHDGIKIRTRWFNFGWRIDKAAGIGIMIRWYKMQV